MDASDSQDEGGLQGSGGGKETKSLGVYCPRGRGIRNVGNRNRSSPLRTHFYAFFSDTHSPTLDDHRTRWGTLRLASDPLPGGAPVVELAANSVRQEMYMVE